jgi:TonB family protein
MSLLKSFIGMSVKDVIHLPSINPFHFLVPLTFAHRTLLCLCLVPSLASPGGTAGADRDVPKAPPASQAAIPSYADSASGLEKLIGNIFRAAKKGDPATLNALIASLSQPVNASWFQSTFGEDGNAMFKEYPGSGPRLASALQAFFAKLRAEQFTQASAHKHEVSCDDDSGELIYPVVVMRQQPVPLYELRLHEGGKFYRLWALAYVDGGFRYVGDLKPPDFRTAPARSLVEGKSTDSANQDVKRVRQGGSLTAAKLLHKIQPQYPDKARSERLQGTVRLHAVIAADGAIRLLRVQTGYCSLGEAAMKAVQQWRYQPTMFQGMPVEVDTPIDVIFSLKQ